MEPLEDKVTPASVSIRTDQDVSYPAIPGPAYLLSHREAGDGWFWPNGKLDAYPAVLKMNVPGSKGNLQLSSAWQAALHAVMTDLQWKRTWTKDEGWHNKGDVGRVQNVVFSHNKVWCIAKDNSKGYQIDTYYNDATPPDLSQTDPYRQGIMTVDYKTGHENTGGVINSDLLLPVLVIVKDESQNPYVEAKYVKPLVWLPLGATVQNKGKNLNVLSAPGTGNIITSIPDLAPITILQLSKIDKDVWGRISQTGNPEEWINLAYTDWEKGFQF